MAETIERGKWHWFNVMSDLEKQAGFTGVIIDPLSVNTRGCSGSTEKGTKFYVTWILDTFLLISMNQEEQALIDAFAKVVEYRPFCKYINKCGVLTVEWDKKDPEGRFAELQKNNEQELQKIV